MSASRPCHQLRVADSSRLPTLPSLPERRSPRSLVWLALPRHMEERADSERRPSRNTAPIFCFGVGG